MELIQNDVRRLLREHGTLTANPDALAPDTDLYEAGLNSLSAVDLMLAVEQTFDFIFPDDTLNRRTFSSIQSIASVVERLKAGATA